MLLSIGSGVNLLRHKPLLLHSKARTVIQLVSGRKEEKGKRRKRRGEKTKGKEGKEGEVTKEGGKKEEKKEEQG